MRSLRQIRRRIRTVENIHDVTRAMEMVAASRYKRAESRLHQLRAYLDNLELVAGRLVNFSKYKHPFAARRSAQRTGPPERHSRAGFVVITSERGLCGAYNTNLLKQAHEFLGSPRVYRAELIIIGKKGEVQFKKRPYDIISASPNAGLKFGVEQARLVSKNLTDLFIGDKLDQVNVLYSHFTSAANFKPRIAQFLPIQVAEPKDCVEYIYEPDEVKLQDEILPVYLAYKMYFIFLSAITSEYASRMISMKAATDNADEMLGHLTLLRNKVRQAGITREIRKMTGGAGALK